jgi:hypothetical protein
LDESHDPIAPAAIEYRMVAESVNDFSDGPAVVGRFTLGKIDSSEWHERFPLRY